MRGFARLRSAQSCAPGRYCSRAWFISPCCMGSSFWTANVSSAAALAFALTGCALLTGCAARADLPKLADVPHFALTDQTGAEFDSAKLANHVWVADFIFTNCPGPCPRMSSQMRHVQTALAVNAARQNSCASRPGRDTAPAPA